MKKKNLDWNSTSSWNCPIKAIFACDAAKKTLRRSFTKNILDIKEQIQHPLYKAINKKAKEFVDDGLDEEEAISSAVSFRKHGIYNLINFIWDNVVTLPDYKCNRMIEDL